MNEIDFVNQSGNWPQYPVLPLSNRTTREAGFLWAGQGPVVFLSNIYRLPGGTFEENVRGLEMRHYRTLKELLVEWRID